MWCLFALCFCWSVFCNLHLCVPCLHSENTVGFFWDWLGQGHFFPVLETQGCSGQAEEGEPWAAAGDHSAWVGCWEPSRVSRGRSPSSWGRCRPAAKGLQPHQQKLAVLARSPFVSPLAGKHGLRHPSDPQPINSWSIGRRPRDAASASISSGF